MSSWMNDAAAVQNHNGNNSFPHMNDPNSSIGAPGAMMDPSAFMANPGQFNPAAANQFANQQQMAAIQNAPMRNSSPSFQNPVYQTNSVIPSKRPRPREDSMGASPRQNPGMLPTSRADTPQQGPYQSFQPNAMQQQPQPPQQQQQQHLGQAQQYPHLQANGSANASPSPVMAGNQLRPGSVPQRVNTASPHSYSPASQPFGPQASPVPSDHGGTPQPANSYMQTQTFPQGFNPSFAGSPSPAGRPPSASNGMMPQMMPQQQMGQMPQQMDMAQFSQMQQMQRMQQAQQMQHMQQMQQAGGGTLDPQQQQKMMYQMRLQQQIQQGNMQMAAQMQAQNMGQGRGVMPNQQGMPMSNGQMAGPPMHPQQAASSRITTPEQFMANVTNFMQSHKLPFEPNPLIEGRPVSLPQLFARVRQFGLYRNVTSRNAWPQVAAAVGFNPQQFSTAPQQIKAIYEQNLFKYEAFWVKSQGQQQVAGASNQAMPPRGAPQAQMSQQVQPVTPGQQRGQTQAKQMTPAMQQASVNGFSPAQQGQLQPSVTPGHSRNSLSRSAEGTPVGADFPGPSPSGKQGSVSMPPPRGQSDFVSTTATSGVVSSPVDPDEYVPLFHTVHPPDRGDGPIFDSHGGHNTRFLGTLGDGLEQLRPDIPRLLELGHIDLHALTRSLQSGIRGEVRLALDTLGTVTYETERVPALSIDLRYCDDLVEALIDCAEEQVDILAEATKPISDEIDLTPYEDLMRQRPLDDKALLKHVHYGDHEDVLDRAADWLIAISTILRNLSFNDHNSQVLAEDFVIKFVCSSIRSLGTHENLLRSCRNTLDYMKDLVVLLSNIAGSVELPGREQAVCLLQLLLAFSPSPSPTALSDKIAFASFDPLLHPYLPHAVDSLAKLLARDEPNRTYYKTVFAADAGATPPYELITRAFGLAISPIPDQNKESRPANLQSYFEARKPTIMQGLLAADVLASLAPGFESGITRLWLSSREGFARNLFRMIRVLWNQAEPAHAPPRTTNPRMANRDDFEVSHAIITWGVSLLKKLSEKARDPNDPSSLPPTAIPSKDSLLQLWSLKNPKWATLLSQLGSYAGIDDC